jgi:hypothetical protein
VLEKNCKLKIAARTLWDRAVFCCRNQPAK